MKVSTQNNSSILNSVTTKLSCCIIVPTYNNCKTIQQVIDGVLEYTSEYPTIVVNDGSTDSTASILKKYNKKITIITNTVNQGKGMALRKAFKKAWEMGFKNAITIDSDGQHYPDDIPLFIAAAKENSDVLIMGSRNMAQKGVPNKSSFGNKFSNFWFKIETGITLPDTQTGFRLYPLEPISTLKLFTTKFETEIEIIVKLAWKKVKIISIPVKVIYDSDNRVSHFRPFKDFTRISVLNTYLVILTLFYYVHIRIFNAIKKEALKKNESNLKKASSIGFGIFMGIVPIWGFQLFVGIPLSIFFKLNKVLFITSANISIPPLIPIIVYVSYFFGTPFIKHHIQITSLKSVTLATIQLNVIQYAVGAVLFALIAGFFSFFVTFVLLSKFRKK